MAAEVAVGVGDVDAPRLRLDAVDGRVAMALGGEPGPELLDRLVGLVAASADPGGWSSAREWVEVNVAAAAVVSFAQALQLVCVRELDRAMQPAAADRPGGLPAGRRAADELAPALGVAPRTASQLVNLACRVQDDLPAAADALAEGRMSLPQVRVLDQVTRDLPTAVTGPVQALAVRVAPHRTPAQLRVVLETEAARLDADYTTRAAASGVEDRDVTLTRSPLPGCRRLQLDLPAVGAAGAWNALNGAAACAQRLPRPDGGEETRRLPQLRADLATALLTGQSTPTTPGLVDVRIPTGPDLTRHAEVHVVIAADTLTTTGSTGSTEGGPPARIPGLGPIDTATARRLAATAPWRRLVTDPATGTLIHRSSRTLPPGPGDTDRRLTELLAERVTDPAALTTGTYRPTERLRRHVIPRRDQTCIGPACQHPAAGIDLDHTTNWASPPPPATPRPARPRPARAAPPATTTSDPGAAGPTTPRPTAAGTWSNPPPAPTPGPAPPAAATTSTPNPCYPAGPPRLLPTPMDTPDGNRPEDHRASTASRATPSDHRKRLEGRRVRGAGGRVPHHRGQEKPHGHDDGCDQQRRRHQWSVGLQGRHRDRQLEQLPRDHRGPAPPPPGRQGSPGTDEQDSHADRHDDDADRQSRGGDVPGYERSHRQPGHDQQRHCLEADDAQDGHEHAGHERHRTGREHGTGERRWTGSSVTDASPSVAESRRRPLVDVVGHV